MNRFVLISLAALVAGLAAPALFAQDPTRSRPSPTDTARPNSQSKTLRDPTRTSVWGKTTTRGSLQGVPLPELKLRGRVLSKKGAIGLLSIGKELHVVRPGDSLTLLVKNAAPARSTRRGSRAPAPSAPTTLSLTLRVDRLDAQGLRLEVVELGRTLTLR